ncbi:MAG: HPt (histidine-containing phosphotransfer) domain-containing protein [Candidatus Krumholzibacteriia bacterium]|jgi:HPt (histidine-containing phosphotransfer) domain-containing protein
MLNTQAELPGPDTPIIDESRLMEEFGGDTEILSELRDLFLEHAPPLYESLLQAMVAQDLTAIARDAHSLKGACATYGAQRIAMVCKAIEMAAEDSNWDDVNSLQDQFVTEFEQTVIAVGAMNLG